MISKILQILGLQPRISKSLEQFFLTVDQNNFGNKIPFLPEEKNEAKPNGICHHHFTSDNKIIRTYTQIVHNMLDFTLLTYTKGLGVMLTENCEVFVTGYKKIFKNIDLFI